MASEKKEYIDKVPYKAWPCFYVGLVPEGAPMKSFFCSNEEYTKIVMQSLYSCLD
jgi:hypothetical protein